MRHEVPVAEGAAGRAGEAGQAAAHHPVGLCQSGQRAQHHRRGEGQEQRARLSRPRDRAGAPEDRRGREAHAEGAEGEPAVGRGDRGEQGRDEERGQQGIHGEHREPPGRAQAAERRAERGDDQHELLGEGVAVELKGLIGQGGEDDDERGNLEDVRAARVVSGGIRKAVLSRRGNQVQARGSARSGFSPSTLDPRRRTRSRTLCARQATGDCRATGCRGARAAVPPGSPAAGGRTSWRRRDCSR